VKSGIALRRALLLSIVSAMAIATLPGAAMAQATASSLGVPGTGT
jgi:hypothetical protein